MKASVNIVYGAPSVLQVKEVPKPAPKPNEVLIKIHATTVNRTDCGFRSPEYFIVRVISGLNKPKKKILGTEFSGIIEAVGSNVTKFKINDAVFGLSTYQFGTHAEYICIAETGSIAHKPNNMTHIEAASVCDGLMLGNNIIKKIDFSKPQRILINGASGSIGTACLQLAKYYGATVTAVCNTKNIELIKSLGADEVIDYTTTDFTKIPNQFDAILDAVGKTSFFKCKHLLKSKGIYISTELGYLSQNVYLSLITPILNRRKVKFPIPTDSQKDIIFYKELIESGNYRAIIDKIYTLDQIVEATKYVETGEKTGNVAITLIAE